MSSELTAQEPVADPGHFENALPIDTIRESKSNPRREFDPGALDELAQSIRTKGLLQPIVVRPNGVRGYELVCGARRLRAAKLAGLEAVPASVRVLTDQEVLEIQVIENLQRRDLHALEEARGYQQLLATKGYDVARIAARVGRSVKYVYDRMKLLQLVPDAQQLFLEGKFTAGHAVLLARLKPGDQERAIDRGDTGKSYPIGGLFAEEHAHLPLEGEDAEKPDPKAKKDPYAGLKTVSVRELQAWIQDRVRAEPGHVDGFLFPETKALLEARQGDKLKPILITNGYMASRDVRHAGKDPIYGQNAWKRADGNERSKTCDWSRVGFVACDEGQGQAFMVCINKDKCTVHWADRVREKQKREKAASSGETPSMGKRRLQEQKQQEEYRAREAAAEAKRARWAKALPAVFAALAEAVKKAPTRANGYLAQLLLDGLYSYEATSKQVEKLVPRGTSAEDLVRHAAMIVIRSQGGNGWRVEDELLPIAKALNVDARKILDQAAPAAKVQTFAKGEPGTCRKCGCTEDNACAGGCAWVDRKQTLCSTCATPAELEAAGKQMVRKARKKGAKKGSKK
jgi:ParB/RepB/Spo0J family partition protein